MFELLQAYETAKHEKNIVLKFIYKNYVRYRLKSAFFRPFRERIHSMEFNNDLLEEFNQFYNCTSKLVYTGVNNEEPYIFYISSDSNVYIITYNNYQFRFKFLENNCDIEVERDDGKILSIHPENKKFYSSFFSKIILMAIYNYCVSYIYGKNSKFYINNNYYVEHIKSMYY